MNQYTYQNLEVFVTDPFENIHQLYALDAIFPCLMISDFIKEHAPNGFDFSIYDDMIDLVQGFTDQQQNEVTNSVKTFITSDLAKTIYLNSPYYYTPASYTAESGRYPTDLPEPYKKAFVQLQNDRLFIHLPVLKETGGDTLIEQAKSAMIQCFGSNIDELTTLTVKPNQNFYDIILKNQLEKGRSK